MMRLVFRIITLPLRVITIPFGWINRRIGCLILVMLFALVFVFWGMMCRLTLVI